MIRFENVTKEFPNGTIAIDDVSFVIDPSEFVFLVGPSGAGKTTILRLLMRELHPTSGMINVDGSDLAAIKKRELPLLRRQIGAVFQDYKLISDRTVYENVALVSDIIKRTQREIDEHVNEILSLVGLEEKRDLFPSQLSGGELQRTTIARALATQPSIIFADEPTGNLDQATAWEIINLLLMINKKDTTVIVSTHNQDIVESVDKRVIELVKGRVVRDTKKPPEQKAPTRESAKSEQPSGETPQKEAETRLEKEPQKVENETVPEETKVKSQKQKRKKKKE
ncbi:MAG: cell division ATP-binding protein FtsE [Candidatus Chisholmbacteria bacterium RIFCSPLOWO2_01_FULL_49_14]|uniref:Cell division ATP-binding protein FtsE n=1 Tax=Candidatus Chisholmbacteria bacterium RIFCSPLOWO2_01_FULL_49_14 TaxID=1797593 RepID=A0A1G1W3C0_9BACT|nr:MAG: cell division ATP-binding protein FtsE [Candidatus Chisholmbacteria bacterium RIFCSPLOWO2_01_FULL_49_14]